VPFSVRVPVEESAKPVGSWIADGSRSKPVTTAMFSDVTITPAIAACIVVISAELARLSTPSAAPTLARLLAKRLAEYVDAQFCNPDVSASVTAGAPTVVASGVGVDDLQALISAYKINGGAVESLVLIMSSANAIGLRLTAPRCLLI